MPLHTRELLMHMLLWQKNVLPIQGAETEHMDRVSDGKYAEKQIKKKL